MFECKFDTDNAVFDLDDRMEAAKILRELAERIEGGALQDYIRDDSGNRIGQFSFLDN